MAKQQEQERRFEDQKLDVPDDVLLPDAEMFPPSSSDSDSRPRGSDSFWETLPFFDEPLQDRDDEVLSGSDEELDDILPFLSVAGHILILLDQMTVNKATDVATHQNWAYVKSLLPQDQVVSWPEIKKAMQVHMKKCREVIDVCVNMCTLYYDPTNPEMQGQDIYNANRIKCNICGEMRYLQGTHTPRRVMYYFPIRHWFSNLFNDPDLVPLLANDVAPIAYAPGRFSSLNSSLKSSLNSSLNSSLMMAIRDRSFAPLSRLVRQSNTK
jgi:hypothetical protein